MENKKNKWIDEHLPLSAYRFNAQTIDAFTWLFVCIASVFCIVDLVLGTGILPLRDISQPSKAFALLFFSPLLVFMVLIRARQLSSDDSLSASWMRSVICLFVFVATNFLKI